MRWNLIKAWPCRVARAPLDALGREMAIAKPILCYESITRG